MIGHFSHDGIGHQSLVSFDPSFVSQIASVEVRVCSENAECGVRSLKKKKIELK